MQKVERQLLRSHSSIISLLITGRLMHILNPWHIEVNLDELYIKVKKRNWFLIGFDDQVYPFKYIRNINTNTHLFGADITIRVIGGKAEVLSIPKSSTRKIKEMLIRYNNSRKGNHIVMH